MKILITGGAGFIGSHVIERLIKDNKIKEIRVLDHLKDGSKKNINHVLKNKKIKFYKKDINNL